MRPVSRKVVVAGLGSAMADMALLLLIFFMVTTTSGPPEGGELTLPLAVSDQVSIDGIIISITKNKELYFNGARVHFDDLDELFVNYTGELRRILLVGDNELSFKEVKPIMDRARENGYFDLIFMTRSDGDEPGP